MKNYIKLFEEFSSPDGGNDYAGSMLRCNPIDVLDAFESHGDDLRWAAYAAAEHGFDVAEKMAEDSGQIMALRALRGCSSRNGVNPVKMIDLIEDAGGMIDDVREMLFVLDQEGDAAVMSMPGGRDFLVRLNAAK